MIYHLIVEQFYLVIMALLFEIIYISNCHLCTIKFTTFNSTNSKQPSESVKPANQLLFKLISVIFFYTIFSL